HDQPARPGDIDGRLDELIPRPRRLVAASPVEETAERRVQKRPGLDGDRLDPGTAETLPQVGGGEEGGVVVVDRLTRGRNPFESVDGLGDPRQVEDVAD